MSTPTVNHLLRPCTQLPLPSTSFIVRCRNDSVVKVQCPLVAVELNVVLNLLTRIVDDNQAEATNPADIGGATDTKEFPVIDDLGAVVNDMENVDCCWAGHAQSIFNENGGVAVDESAEL